MSAIIEVRNLGKQYKIGARQNRTDFRDVLTRALRAPLSWLPGRRKRDSAADRTTVWALRDLNFDVQEGEVVGIIGRNGAGKSTLLKVLSRITEPTCGSIRLRGHMSSLLEVGTGFHPDLTGRENIFLNGAILGMRRAEIVAKFDEIVAFAEIGAFLDTPVKRYSSGMYVRLAFAVAAHLEQDILVVDEVLAVGDQGFQKKCLGKMGDVSKSGRTVLFVSHQMAAVGNLCSRAIWIADGMIKEDGLPENVIGAYLNSFGAAEEQTLDLSAIRERRGTGAVRLLKMEFVSDEGAERCVVQSGGPLHVRLHYECYRDIPNLHFGLRIYSNLGVLISDIHTWTTGQEIPLAPKGVGTIDLEIDSLNLMPSTYWLGVWVSSFHEWHDVLDNVAQINVEPSDFYGTGRGLESRFGLVFFPFRWTASSDGAAAIPGRGDESPDMEAPRREIAPSCQETGESNAVMACARPSTPEASNGEIPT
jgi:lipopolysaccharide transport system ATP-binding protein